MIKNEERTKFLQTLIESDAALVFNGPTGETYTFDKFVLLNGVSGYISYVDLKLMSRAQVSSLCAKTFISKLKNVLVTEGYDAALKYVELYKKKDTTWFGNMVMYVISDEVYTKTELREEYPLMSDTVISAIFTGEDNLKITTNSKSMCQEYFGKQKMSDFITKMNAIKKGTIVKAADLKSNMKVYCNKLNSFNTQQIIASGEDSVLLEDFTES